MSLSPCPVRAPLYVASFVLSLSACDVLEPVESSSVAVEANVIDPELLAELLGDPASLAEETPCDVIGLACRDPIDAILRECGGFSNTCDSTGTQEILRVGFLCLPSDNGNGNVCKAIAVGSPRTVDCTVPTDGRSCSTGCATFCETPGNECSLVGPRVRVCRSGGVCSSDTCVNEASTREVVGTCERETDGQSCTHVPRCRTDTLPTCVTGNCICVPLAPGFDSFPTGT